MIHAVKGQVQTYREIGVEKPLQEIPELLKQLRDLQQKNIKICNPVVIFKLFSLYIYFLATLLLISYDFFPRYLRLASHTILYPVLP